MRKNVNPGEVRSDYVMDWMKHIESADIIAHYADSERARLIIQFNWSNFTILKQNAAHEERQSILIDAYAWYP